MKKYYSYTYREQNWKIKLQVEDPPKTPDV